MPDDVRLAQPADAEQVAALVQAAYRGEGGWTTEAGLVEGTRMPVERLTALLAETGATVLLLEDDDGILACCQLTATQPGTVQFGLFAVWPAKQGGGTGRRMVAAAEAHAREAMGAHTLELSVLHQRVELIAWYERLGFTRTGERRPFPVEVERERWLVADLEFVVLAKPLR